jgi:hypothetical protein
MVADPGCTKNWEKHPRMGGSAQIIKSESLTGLGIWQFFKASTAPDPVYHELRPAGLPGDLWGFFKQYGRQEEARLNLSIRTRKRFIANLRI